MKKNTLTFTMEEIHNKQADVNVLDIALREAIAENRDEDTIAEIELDLQCAKSSLAYMYKQNFFQKKGRH